MNEESDFDRPLPPRLIIRTLVCEALVVIAVLWLFVHFVVPWGQP